DHVDLPLLDRPIEQPQIHGFEVPFDAESVSFHQPGEAIRTLQKFVARAHHPVGLLARGLAERMEIAPPGFVAANHYCKRVVKAEWSQPLELPAFLIFRAHLS